MTLVNHAVELAIVYMEKNPLISVCLINKSNKHRNAVKDL